MDKINKEQVNELRKKLIHFSRKHHNIFGLKDKKTDVEFGVEVRADDRYLRAEYENSNNEGYMIHFTFCRDDMDGDKKSINIIREIHLTPETAIMLGKALVSMVCDTE